MKALMISLRLLLAMTVLTGIIYPLSLVAVGRIFPRQADGSLIFRDGRLVGSTLLAQKNESPRYFQPRPSAADYATVPSGASNFGPTSAPLAQVIDERRSRWGANAPVDLLTASGSGLDPHISPEAAALQVPGVAKNRGIPEADVRTLLKKFTDGSQFGFLGEPRVRILELNLALDDSRNP